MLFQSPDGRYLEVRRRWMPWRPRKRRIDTTDSAFDLVSHADDPASFVVLLVAGILFAIFGGILLTFALLAGEFLLLLLLLIPVLALARWFWILPWIIEVLDGGQPLGIVRVRGWRDSEERIQDLVAAYQRGENPPLS